ncbi:hypothetical protein EV643_102615 [Kribbella sp. VKM Ac-2527]|uniref:Neocarzinostatin family protein n=1 Tax=Kribbella caucasensis TaxID=2512215 RepID=A0A4R6KMV3_9ACTN|nr:hypothetical protein [Kribbella sp. VKM Ac-2527]TDO52773.1 hypothetical protein EV643_102615 [Kribbella sp. VKM Ac-2527]
MRLPLSGATALTAGLVAPASAAPGSASNLGMTLNASNATGLAAAGETITVTGSGYNPLAGYYVALCAVPSDYSYGTKPSPCAGGDGQGGTGVGASAWVTNAPIGGSASYPIAADGTFTAQIHIGEVNTGLDCSDPEITCAIVTRRDHLAAKTAPATSTSPSRSADGPLTTAGWTATPAGGVFLGCALSFGAVPIS